MSTFSFLIIVTSLLIIFFIFLWLTYNSFIRQINRVKNEYSNIDIQLKRRSSLLQNLADMVKAYAKHEKETFIEVTKARSAVDASKNANDFAKAETMIGQTVRSLYGVVEHYPELKASENYHSLQGDFRDTENTIAIYREGYNKAVLQYNTMIQTFPNILVATIFNFKTALFFQSSDQDNRITI